MKKVLEKIELTLSVTKDQGMLGHEYLTNLILSVPIVLIESNEIKELNMPAVAFTDFKSIYVITDSATELTPAELLFVLEHEIMHILSEHDLRGKDKDPFLWNLATDAWINAILQKNLPTVKNRNDFPGIYPPNGIFMLNSVDASSMSEEEIYDYLSKNAKVNVVTVKIPINSCSDEQQNNQGKSQQNQQQQNQQGDSCNDQNLQQQSGQQNQNHQSNGDGHENTQEIEVTVIEIEIEGKKFAVSADVKAPQNKNVPDNVKKDFTERVKELGRSLKESMKNRGFESRGFFEVIDRILKIEVPWDDILKIAIRNVAVRKDTRTWVRPNYYMRPVAKKVGVAGFPGQGDEYMPENLVIAIDTSGSISQKELSKFLYVIAESAEYFRKIVRIEHDYNITAIKEYDHEDFDSITMDKEFFFVSGRGGTSHAEVFEKITEMLENGEDISLLIFLTDYYSDVEEIKDSYRWIDEIPIIWILTTDLKPSFGKVIKIN